MKTTCDIIQDLLPLYCDGVCSTDSAALVEAHVQTCETCAQELRLMQDAPRPDAPEPQEQVLVRAAARAWKRGKHRAFLTGCLLALLLILVVVGGCRARHWCTSAGADELDRLARQAADYFGYESLSIVKLAQRGSYLAALCRDPDGSWCMCQYDRDRVFDDRWFANGGIPSLAAGGIDSWNYGSPQREAVLIICGYALPGESCWYSFQNSGITYTCPVEDSTVLDIFVIPDQSSISTYPITLLDSTQQEINS